MRLFDLATGCPPPSGNRDVEALSARPSSRLSPAPCIFGAAVALLLGAAPLVAQSASKTFLWTLSAPGAPPSYLMGSLHVLTPEYYPLGAQIEEAFAKSKVLITETDIDAINDPVTMTGFIGKALLTDRTLDEVISPALYKQVMDRAGRAGIPGLAIQRMKPWFAALALTAPALQSAGFKAEFGVDKHFSERAKSLGLERRTLESVAFQFDRMDQMSAADQEALLRSTIEDLDTQTNNVKSIADAWARGDTAVLEKLLLSGMKTTPALYQRMLVERNANWVADIAKCVAEKMPCFVVVGAAHLIGPDSLVAMLEKKGYTLEQQ